MSEWIMLYLFYLHFNNKRFYPKFWPVDQNMNPLYICHTFLKVILTFTWAESMRRTGDDDISIFFQS